MTDTSISAVAEPSVKSPEGLNTWHLAPGRCYVCIAKQLGTHHWCLLRTIRVKEVNFEQQSIDAVILGYHQADGDYWLKCEESRMLFDRLRTIAAGASIYAVDEVQLSVLSQPLLELTITKSKLRNFEEAVEACAEYRVS